MALAEPEGKPLVSPLLTMEEVPMRRLTTVRVRMLRDGRGITSHGNRPALVEPSADDVLDVSSDLAENWGTADPPYCDVYSEPAAEAGPIAPAVVEPAEPEPSTAKSEKPTAPHAEEPKERGRSSKIGKDSPRRQRKRGRK